MADAQPDRQADQRLLEAILAFAAAHPDPGVQPFREGVANWGRDWIGVPPSHLPASDTLIEALGSSIPETSDLVALFAAERGSRNWEQSHSRAEKLVGEHMLLGYGFAEVIGKHGPFLSERVRAGIGVWGPRIDYPPHRHQAEEVYVVLAGSAEFHLDGEAPAVRCAGEAVHVRPMQTHGFRTLEELLAVFYIWQHGDLREKSTFD